MVKIQLMKQSIMKMITTLITLLGDHLQEMYLLKRPNGKVIERPQHMYMRVALWVTEI